MVTIDARQMRSRLIAQGVDPDVAREMVAEFGKPELMSARLGEPAGNLSFKAYFKRLGYAL